MYLLAFDSMLFNFFDSIPKEILERAKKLDLNINSSNAHSAIDEILDKTVLSGGKRLRPLLTFLMADLFNCDLDKIMPYARATELVHAASLSHDDVIDNATQRRGAPSINILASNKKAVLAGDYLLSKVIVDLTNEGNLRLVKEMSLVIKDLSEGEWLQLDLIESRDYTKENIITIAKMKTSSVMSYCTSSSAILRDMPEEVINDACLLGLNLGIAFQMIDDTLDYKDSSDKDLLLDLKNGIVNSVVFNMFTYNQDLFLRFKKGEDLMDLLKNIEMRKYSENIHGEASEYLELSKLSLKRIQNYLSSSIYQGRDQELSRKIKSIEFIFKYIKDRSH